jgi:hypothetical protein
MGAIKESKMPKGVTKKRRDDTDFTQYKKGGAVKSLDKLAKQEIDTKRIGKKEGGKITAANYDQEYGKIYRKVLKKKGK